LIAAVRDGKAIPNVGTEFIVQACDRLVLLGDCKALDSAGRLVSPATVLSGLSGLLRRLLLTTVQIVANAAIIARPKPGRC
jgi:hypothetical protein